MAGSHRITAVNLGTKVRTFATAIVLFVMPAMACLVPGARLTAAERDCCKKMAGQCEQSHGTGSHSCCQQSTEAKVFNLEVKSKSIELNPLASGHVAHFPPPGVLPSSADELSLLRWIAESHGPPPLGSLSSTILRI